MPVTTSCHSWAMPIICRPFLRVSMMRAPTTVPMIVARPPASEVPPMTTAAMTFSSKPTPSAGWTKPKRPE